MMIWEEMVGGVAQNVQWSCEDYRLCWIPPSLTQKFESSLLRYKNSTLDVPERLEDAHSLFDSEAHEMTGGLISQHFISPESLIMPW
jgi:hypothetical protein